MVDGKPVGAGVVGPVTRQLMARFEAYFADTVQTAGAGSRGRFC